MAASRYQALRKILSEIVIPPSAAELAIGLRVSGGRLLMVWVFCSSDRRDASGTSVYSLVPAGEIAVDRHIWGYITIRNLFILCFQWDSLISNRFHFD